MYPWINVFQVLGVFTFVGVFLKTIEWLVYSLFDYSKGKKRRLL